MLAAELPPFSNRSTLCDMVPTLTIFMAAKGLRGPQSSGLHLWTRKDLVEACAEHAKVPTMGVVAP